MTDARETSLTLRYRLSYFIILYLAYAHNVIETCDNFVINLAFKQIFSSCSVASSFLGQHNAQNDDRQHHHNDDKQPAKPLTRVLLV